MAESPTWMNFAQGNPRAAELCLGDRLLHPALQNAQQAVEKALKSALTAAHRPVRRTHSIASQREELFHATGFSPLDPDEADLLDSVYLPSKYPLDEWIPEFSPEHELAATCLELARRVVEAAAPWQAARMDTPIPTERSINDER